MISNSKLRGDTFDAKHISTLLNKSIPDSEVKKNFKENNSPSPHHRSVNGRKSLPNSEAEREFRMSSSFMTPKREDMKQKYFLETYNGSPGLIRYKGESPNDLYGQPYQESSLQNFKQKSKIGNIAVPSESDLKLRSSV